VLLCEQIYRAATLLTGIRTTANRFTLRGPVITPADRSIYLATVAHVSAPAELLAQIGVRFHLLLFRDRPETIRS
jgi:hypothetical protein